MPDLAVPIAAPAQLRTIAAQQPANPKNGANAGEYSDSGSVDLELVDTHLAQIRDKGDPALAKSVRRLVAQFVDGIFDDIQHSLEIDDVAASQLASNTISSMLANPALLNEKIEPYDFALNDRLRDLYTRVEEKVESLSNLRRTQPASIRDEYEALVRENETVVDAIVAESAQNRAAASDAAAAVPDMDDLRHDFKCILNDLADLKHDVPETRHGVDNLANVISFVHH
ncbi:hypothetical protein KL918_002929 [Ogataea parapolymorpha]|nr:hypothetical protein KL918_002929 [Ogataea parapolymorpha]KAG7871885.1 hypothetical protein KL916_003488 [Ogataea parapolymorpha]